MEIRMRTLMAGPNSTRHPGEVCVVTAEEGEMLVCTGHADAIAAAGEDKPQQEADAIAAAGEDKKPGKKK